MDRLHRPRLLDGWTGPRSLGRAGEVSSHAAGIAMLTLATLACLRHVLGSDLAATDRVFAAVTAWVLAGVACGLIFEHVWRPGRAAFERPASAASAGSVDMASLFESFSFTTLGYGGVVAVDDLARFGATTEAIFGRLHLAVVIAWLVSRHAASAPR